jgi:hypothetical protein
MNKILGLISLSALTLSAAPSHAAAPFLPKMLLNCTQRMSLDTATLAVYQTDQNIFHYYASICQPDPQGSSFDTGPCQVSQGDMQGSDGKIFNTGLDTEVTINFECGMSIAFNDRATPFNLIVSRSNCQISN